MNVMNVLVSETVMASNVKVQKGQNEGETNSFLSFLQSEGQMDTKAGQSYFQESEAENSIDNVMFPHTSLPNGVLPNLQEQFLAENEDVLQLISQLLNGELTSLEDVEIDEKLATQLTHFLQMIDLAEYNLAPEIIDELELLLQTQLDTEVTEEIQLSSINVIQYELTLLAGEISRILNRAEDVPLKNQASELLPLLRQWKELKEQAESGEAERIISNELSEKDATIWKQLVNVYEKRSFFTENNLYRSDSAVTRTDVMNWLQQAFSNYETQAEKITAPIATQQQIPMTEVQQYTIHVNSLDRVERVSDEVMTKFQNIIRESRFMTNNNMNELSITLRPENLGNMTVRLTQIDGEMTVKIIVSSLAAKNMLEANIHQLKHMFSPHQVVIERNESISDKEFFNQEEELQEHEEESLEEGNDSRENNEDESTEIDFTDLFQQLSEEALANE